MTEEQHQRVYAIATQTFPHMGKDKRTNFEYTGFPVLSYVVPGDQNIDCTHDHHASHRPHLYTAEEIPALLQELSNQGYKGLSVIDLRSRVMFDTKEVEGIEEIIQQ